MEVIAISPNTDLAPRNTLALSARTAHLSSIHEISQILIKKQKRHDGD
jgi:hypothetical protein